MPQDPDQSLVFCILSGALALAAGAMAVFYMAPWALALVGLILLLRICWLDDNIVRDLMAQDTLPPGYHATFQRRQYLALLLFGVALPEAPRTPAQLATRMRAEMQVWTIVLLAGLGTMLLHQQPFGPALSVCAALALWAQAFRGADRLALTLWYVETGRALTQAALTRRLTLFE